MTVALRRLFLCLALTVPASALAVEETYFSVKTALAYGYGTDLGEAAEASVTVEPRLELAAGSGVELVLSGLARVDDADALLPGEPDLDSYSGASRPFTAGSRTFAEIRDAYLEWRRGSHRLRLGKQQIVWGALDGLKVLDTLNPQSFREFILEDFGASRIGLWSLYADTTVGATRLEVALIPDVTTHDVPEVGAWFELTAPRFRFGAPPAAPALPVRTVREDDPLDGGTAGLRVSRTLGRVDFTAVAVSGLDFEPLGRVASTAAGVVIERFHKRREVFGLSAERAAGRFVLRAEAGYLPGRHFNVRSDGGLDHQALDQWRLAVAADVQGPWDVLLNVQYLHDRVESAPDGLIRPARESIVTAFARRSFSYDRLTTELRWYATVGEDDGMIRAEVAYGFGNSRLRLRADSYYGDQEGLFGQFERRDRLTLVFEHTL